MPNDTVVQSQYNIYTVEQVLVFDPLHVTSVSHHPLPGSTESIDSRDNRRKTNEEIAATEAIAWSENSPPETGLK